MVFTQAEAFWAFGVFFKPLEYEFGWSRSEVSSCYTTLLIGFAISAVLSGKLADKYNPRSVLLVIAVLAGLGNSLASQVNTIDQLRALLFLSGLGAGGTWSVPISIVQRWFIGRRKAGMALSIVTCGVGFGGLFITPFVNYLVLTQGWRYAYLIVGILYFAIVAIAAMVIRSPPIVVETLPVEEKLVSKPVTPRVWTSRKVIVTPAFISISIVVVLAVIAFQIITVHLVPHATDVGIPSMASAAALGLIGGFSVPGRILAGMVADRIGWQRTLAIAMFSSALSIPFVIFMNNATMLYVFVFLYGMSHGIRAPSQIGLLTGFFGVHSLGEIIGIVAAVAQLVGAFAPYLAGYIFDTTGSYSVAFILIMVLLIAAGVILVRMKEPR